MASFGPKHRATGGTFESPLSTIRVLEGVVEKRATQVSNITAHTVDGLAVKTVMSNYQYSGTLSGVYVQGTPKTDTLNDTPAGTLTVKLGTGEKWTGSFLIEEIRVSPNYVYEDDVEVAFSGVWNGTPTVTRT